MYSPACLSYTCVETVQAMAFLSGEILAHFYRLYNVQAEPNEKL